MTTVVFDGTILASDSTMVDEHEMKIRFGGKLRRLKDGRLAGFAGDLYSGLAILDWLDGKKSNLDKNGEADALVASSDGKIVAYDGTGRAIEIKDKLYAIGTGAEIALGAVYAGATAIRAVEIAILLDNNSGGEPISLSFKGTPSARRRPKK